MISTLIRSSNSNTIAGVNTGTSEYLVDTETNEIIFPYTLTENILSTNGSGGISGGIDSSTYVSNTVDLAGTKVPAKTSKILLYKISDQTAKPGIYLLYIIFNQESFTSRPNSSARYKSISVQNCNTNEMILGEPVTESNGGYVQYSATGMFTVEGAGIDINVHYQNSIDSEARYMDKGSYLRYKYIRICDLK